MEDHQKGGPSLLSTRKEITERILDLAKEKRPPSIGRQAKPAIEILKSSFLKKLEDELIIKLNQNSIFSDKGLLRNQLYILAKNIISNAENEELYSIGFTDRTLNKYSEIIENLSQEKNNSIEGFKSYFKWLCPDHPFC